MRISDWSSDVCSSNLEDEERGQRAEGEAVEELHAKQQHQRPEGQRRADFMPPAEAGLRHHRARRPMAARDERARPPPEEEGGPGADTPLPVKGRGPGREKGGQFVEMLVGGGTN